MKATKRLYIKAKPVAGGNSQRVGVDSNGGVYLTNRVINCSFWDEVSMWQADKLCKQLNESVPDFIFTVEKD